MDSLGEILHLCRLCLVKDHVNIPIFDDPGNIRQIPLKISSCLPVQISRNDNLPKKICDGCSEKLDLCYEFWNSSAIAEKKLLSMVAEKENQIVEPPVPQPILMKAELVSMDNITSEQVAEEESQSEPLVPQPIVVKQEAEVLDTFESSVERTEETEAPPSKRPRRSAAIKAQKNIVPESDDDDDDEGAATEDINSEEPLTKEEPYVDEDIHTEVPDMSVDDAQPGTSGLNQGMEDSTLAVSNIDDELNALLDDGFSVVDDIQTVSPESNRKRDIQKKQLRKLRGKDVQDHLYCPKCGQRCKNYEEYDSHILANLSHHSFDCFQCGKTVESWQDLRTHGESVHGALQFLAAEKAFATNNQETVYFCHFCGEKKMSIGQINIHITNNHSKEFINCTMCQRFCKNPQALFTHVEYVHALINNVDLVCNQCQYHFYDPELYSFHMTKFHQVDLNSLTYQCILCSDALKDIEGFLRHVHQHGKYTFLSAKHDFGMKNGRPTFVVWSRQCFICSKVHQSRLELDEHLSKVHFSRNMCPLCNEKVKGQMKFHLKDKHSFSLDNKVNSDRAKDASATPHVKQGQSDFLRTEKICAVCYGLVKRKSFRLHMTIHEERGTERFKSENPVVDTVPEKNQFSNCKHCSIKVVTTFMKWHEKIHEKEDSLKKKQSSDQLRSTNKRGRSNSRRSRSPLKSRPRRFLNKRGRDRTRQRSRSRTRSRPEMKCSECDRRYDTVENLVNHVKAQHFTVAPQQNQLFNPFVTGMVPLEFNQSSSGDVIPYGLQHQASNLTSAFSQELQGFSVPRRFDRNTRNFRTDVN